MAGETHTLPPKTQRSNRVIAGVCLAFFGGMVGAAYASVPLYKLFCQMTGYGGTTQRVEQYSDKMLDRTITVRFDTNMSGGMPWDFAPVQRDMTMKIGETVEGKIPRHEPVRPADLGPRHLQRLAGDGRRLFQQDRMLLLHRHDVEAGRDARHAGGVLCRSRRSSNVPELKDIRTITLSYTFFPIDGEKPVAAADRRRPRQGTSPDSKIGG